ncbi:MAG: DUF58 domain-containing protein [Anaerolineales bacterium]|jgi:uncharacterized protein (DUF58 family)
MTAEKKSAQIRLKSRLIPILVILVFLMQIIDPYQVWMFTLVALGGTWLISYLWVRALSRYLALKREIRFGWAQVGDRLEERFTVYNRGPVPVMWVEVIDRSNMPDYMASRVTGVESRSKNQWRTQGICSQRGLFTLGPTTLKMSDPFGIYEVEIEDPSSTSLMVMPPIVPLPTIAVAPGGRTGDARPRTNAPERTVSSSTVREFNPGDSLRWIHWRTTARKSSPYVRIFDGTPAGDWWIFLDLDSNVQAGEGWNSTQEHGIILAASLADRGLRENQSIGLVANGKELVWLSPQGDDRQRWEILRALALIENGDYSLAELLTRNKSLIGRYTSLVIITPNTNGDWIESLIPLMWRGAVPTVILLDPVSFNGYGEVAHVLDLLTEMGVSRHVITRDVLDRPEARPGDRGQWEWRISATGKAFPVKKPSDMSWKVLS